MRNRLILLIATATLVAMTGYATTGSAAAAATPAAAAVNPVAAVHPNHGLSPFDIVTVSGTGLPAGTAIDVIQCDVPSSEGDEGPIGCAPQRTVTTTAQGKLSTPFNVLGTVYREQQLGDPDPVYCRADQCRYFLEWTDAAGFHSIATPKMIFAGSPATLAATPTTGLADGAAVRVTGTAHGATGRYVIVDEVSCFQIIQGNGCNGAIPLGTLKLTAGGTFAGTLDAYRYLGDGEDCSDSFYGCQLRVTVLNSDGNTDTSFGDPADGDQSVAITFAA